VLVRVGEFLDRPLDRSVERLEAQADAGPGFGPAPPLHEALLASVPTPVLRSFRERLLGPLWEYDDRHSAELMSTLRAFLACDGSWSVCASRMYVHVNTVRYRISRVEALTGRDLSALADRVDFFLALRAV
jgi:DNA-binding PucR family transcriptional regulator